MAKYSCFWNNCLPNHKTQEKNFDWKVWPSALVPAQKSLSSWLNIGAFNFPSKQAFPKHVSVHQRGAGEPSGLALLPCHSLHPWLLSADQHVAPPMWRRYSPPSSSSALVVWWSQTSLSSLLNLAASLKDLPKICTRYAPDMPQICPRYAHDMPMICPRYALDMP